MTGSPLAIMAARDISIEEAGEIGVGHEIDHLNITECPDDGRDLHLVLMFTVSQDKTLCTGKRSARFL